MSSIVPTNGDIYPHMYSGSRVGARQQLSANYHTIVPSHPVRRCSGGRRRGWWSHDPYAGCTEVSIAPTTTTMPSALVVIMPAPVSITAAAPTTSIPVATTHQHVPESRLVSDMKHGG